MFCDTTKITCVQNEQHGLKKRDQLRFMVWLSVSMNMIIFKRDSIYTPINTQTPNKQLFSCVDGEMTLYLTGAQFFVLPFSCQMRT